MQPNLLTRNEVAKICLVTPTTVKNWQKKGTLKASYILNGHPRFSSEDVQSLLSNAKPQVNDK